MTPPAVAPYAPPRSSFAIDLKLDANEGRCPPPALLEPVARDALDELHLYPSGAYLETKLAARLDADPAQLLVTAGGDDALDRVCRAFLAPGRTAIMTSPTFEMIPRAARATGAELVEVPWWSGPFPTPELLARIDSRTALVFVVTPNNPTGAVAAADDLRAIAAAAPHAVLCVDLAYTEYADADLTAAALSLSNAVIVRTLSKAWGLAGLRVGYAAGAATLVSAIRAAAGPFPTSGISLALTSRWLDAGESFMRETAAITREERARLTSILKTLGIDVIESQANFVLARFPDARRIADALAEHHRIGVRRFPAASPLADYLRITCPCEAGAFARLTGALRVVLSAGAST